MTKLSMVMLVINWASSVAFGLFAFYLYRRETAKKLHSLREKHTDVGVYHAELLARSGPSRVAVGCLFAAMFLLSLIFTWYVGPDKIVNMYYNM